MISLSRFPLGGFGNRLFHYDFIVRLARRLNLDITLPKKCLCDPVLWGEKVKFRYWVGKKGVVLDAGLVGGLTDSELFKVVLEAQRVNKNVSLRGAFLGDFFFRIKDFQGGGFTLHERWQIKCTKRICAIHMRGGDFMKWDPKAILSNEYYINSIDRVSKDNGSREGLVFSILTDDVSLPAYKVVKNYLNEKGFQIYLGNGGGNSDFSIMSDSEYLISSPSTFAIWAGVFGRPNKKIIHSRSWMDYQVGKGDAFWSEVNLGGSDRYSAWEVIDG